MRTRGTFGDSETCLSETSVARMQKAQPLIGFQLEEESLTTKSHLRLKNNAWRANGGSRSGSIIVYASIKILTAAREIKLQAKALSFGRVFLSLKSLFTKQSAILSQLERAEKFGEK